MPLYGGGEKEEKQGEKRCCPKSNKMKLFKFMVCMSSTNCQYQIIDLDCLENPQGLKIDQMASIWMVSLSFTHRLMTQKLLYFYLPRSSSQKLGLSQPNASKMNYRMYTYS